MAFGLLSSIIPGTGPVVDLYEGPANKLTVGKITIGSKNYNPSRIQIGYRDGSNIRYFEYNRYIKYGEVIETENLYIGAGQKLVVRSTESDVNFLFYGQTTNDVINPVRSGILQHTISTGATKQALYTAPGGSESKVTVSICNLGPDPATVKLGLSDGGLNDFGSTEYLDFGFSIAPGQTYTRPDIKLGAGQSLIGFSNPKSKVTFLCHGQLFYEVSGLPTSDDFVVLGNSRFDGNVGVGRSATAKFDVLGDAIITGNTKIKSVNYNEDIDNVRNIRSIGISTFTGALNIDGDLRINTNSQLRVRSNDIVLGFSTDTLFTATAGAGSTIIHNVSPITDIIEGIPVTLVSPAGLTIPSGTKIVSIASSTVYLSDVIGGSGTYDDAQFLIGDPTDEMANNGGIVIKGTTDKSILWQTTTGDFNFSHGATFHTGRVHLVDSESKITIGSTDVITKDKVLGKTIINEIVTANDSELYLPTARAVTKRSRQMSSEQYFLTSSW